MEESALPLVLLGLGGCLVAILLTWQLASRSRTRANESGPGPSRTPRSAALGDARTGVASFLSPWMSALIVGGFGLLVVLLITWVFGELTLLPAVVAVDRPILTYFAEHRVGWLDPLMTGATQIGSYELTIAFGVVVASWLAVKRRWLLPSVLLASAWLAVWGIQQLLKQLVDGSVPPASIAMGPAGPYPSGGVARVTGMVMMAALLLVRAHGYRSAPWIWSAAALLVFVEAYSRVYLGRHWAVDTVGGLLVGALCALTIEFAASFATGNPSLGGRFRMRLSRERSDERADA